MKQGKFYKSNWLYPLLTYLRRIQLRYEKKSKALTDNYLQPQKSELHYEKKRRFNHFTIS
uniref:YhaB protein n=1 Tax=Escherichia coli TaxID=562 RepID=M1EY10_ECOLX|nr:YhaB protein [Escherichia coli]AJL34874.1 YhaB protein [Escherichia coli]